MNFDDRTSDLVFLWYHDAGDDDGDGDGDDDDDGGWLIIDALINR